jgi:small-conductance mechanosensitive channel
MGVAEGLMRKLSLALCLLVLLWSPALGQDGPAPSPTPVVQQTPAVRTTPRAVLTPTVERDTRVLKDPFLSSSHPERHQAVSSDTGPFIKAVSRSGTLSLADSRNLTGKQRANVVRKRLDTVLNRYGSEPQSVYVDDSLGPVVVRTHDEILATVLDEDLPEYYGDLEDPDARRAIKLKVADKWRHALQYELNAGAFFKTSAYARFAFWSSVALLVLAFLLHKLTDWLARRFLHRPAWAVKIVIWLSLIMSILWLSPTTKRLGLTLIEDVLEPYLWAGVAVVGGVVVTNVGDELILRYYRALLQYTPESNVRITQRVAALSQAAGTILRILVVVVGVFLFLMPFDIDWAPVATGAGILGVAASLAAQDLLRDLVAGVNILVEDQFGVGDWVEIQGEIGEVEGFNLRSTSVRTRDGALVTFQNSTLSRVSNLSKRWAQVDFQVDVSYGDDLDRCMAVMMEEIEGLSQEWAEKIVAAPELLGVENLGTHGITLRCLVRTKPIAQFSVHRELNRRVKNRFDKEGITIPFPQQQVWLERSSDSQPPTPND